MLKYLLDTHIATYVIKRRPAIGEFERVPGLLMENWISTPNTTSVA